MSRRREVQKRPITPDAKYKDKMVAKFANILMIGGKKSTAEGRTGAGGKNGPEPSPEEAAGIGSNRGGDFFRTPRNRSGIGLGVIRTTRGRVRLG